MYYIVLYSALDIEKCLYNINKYTKRLLGISIVLCIKEWKIDC